jgi:hypothetical protein
MGAKLSGGTSTASVSAVRARASVTATGLNAISSAATPAADVAYILLTVGASLDTSGRYKYLPEIVVISDAVQKLVEKATQDSVSVTDAVTLSTTLGLADSISFTETFLATLVFIRNLADSVAVSDQTTLDPEKRLTETVALTETLQYAFNKYLADGVAIGDSFEAADGLLYAFSKYVSNVVFVQDSAVLYPSKVFSDMISVQDAGSLRSQGYCDFSYFAEDYVGASRTF